MGKLKLAVFISGRGSNLQSIIDACADENFPAQISVVLSNKADVFGLERAQKAGIPTEVVSHKDFAAREEFEHEIQNRLEKYAPDLICLAGFIRILSDYLPTKWAGRMLNIHPSLLPDYKGLHTHQRAIDDGKTEAGCTIHYVVPELDSGEIIVQKRVPILPGDTADTLAARVLEQEHVAYPEAIKIVAEKLR